MQATSDHGPRVTCRGSRSTSQHGLTAFSFQQTRRQVARTLSHSGDTREFHILSSWRVGWSPISCLFCRESTQTFLQTSRTWCSKSGAPRDHSGSTIWRSRWWGRNDEWSRKGEHGCSDDRRRLVARLESFPFSFWRWFGDVSVKELIACSFFIYFFLLYCVVFISTLFWMHH